ncbi:MAG: HAD family hydrolase [Ruminococcus sp.]|nr:HAD family hydrolase [Ruminococcus sp.]
MIKLIATDMDGTLLDDKKNLPENFDEVVNKLFEKNIKFVISSGRSFCALKAQFKDYLDDMSFICDNGAYVVDCRELIYVSLLPKNIVKRCIALCEQNGYTLLLCGKNGTWHNSKNTAAHKEIAQYYNNQVFTEDLNSVNDDIFKAAVFEEGGIESDGYIKLLNEFASECNVQLSGRYWVDLMSQGSTKGTALKRLENRIGIGYEETMAFGDYLNDIDMLNNSYYSFAMSNAHDSIKQVANFLTGSNNENSVMKEISKYCL